MHCCVYILTYAIDILCCIELLITLLSVLVTFHGVNFFLRRTVYIASELFEGFIIMVV